MIDKIQGYVYSVLKTMTPNECVTMIKKPDVDDFCMKLNKPPLEVTQEMVDKL